MGNSGRLRWGRVGPGCMMSGEEDSHSPWRKHHRGGAQEMVVMVTLRSKTTEPALTTFRPEQGLIDCVGLPGGPLSVR